ncbi:MAG: hypothetical protein Q8P26_01625 [Candidatus Levybacteria bacterium]|nr:hypothetical protein [Candidatus Levybacteria bacterium]
MSAEVPQSNFRNSQAELVLNKPELAGVKNWYKEQLRSFGEMTVEAAPLTDGNQWKRELTANGEVDKVDGSFFTLQGQTVVRYNPDGLVAFKWTQPGLLQKEGDVSIPSGEKQEKIKLSGFVGIIKDQNNNILLSLAPEPFANTPKKVLARTPVQTSAAKLQGLLDGKKELDPQLYDLLTALAPGKTVDEIFRMGILDIFPLPYADANRIAATNLGFAMQVKDAELIKKLENNGKNRWCNLNEVKALAKAGILNGLRLLQF